MSRPFNSKRRIEIREIAIDFRFRPVVRFYLRGFFAAGLLKIFPYNFREWSATAAAVSIDFAVIPGPDGRRLARRPPVAATFPSLAPSF